MIRTLLKIRISSTFSGMFTRRYGNRKTSLGKKVLMSILFIYCIAAFLMLFGMMFSNLAEVLYMAGLSWAYFAIAGVFAFVFCFVGSVFATSSQIFNARDNELLLSMPIKPGHIIASRIMAVLLLNYLFEFIIIVPAGVVWAVSTGAFTVAGVVCFIVASLLLAFLSLTFSCLLGWLVALISSRMRRKNLVTTVLSLVLFGAYFYVCFNFNTYITRLASSGVQIAEALRSSVFPAYHFGVAAAEGNFLSLLLFALCAVIPFLIVYFIVSKNFIGIATANRGTAKVKYREKTLKTSGARWALTKKELRHFISMPGYVLNAAMGVVFMLVATVFVIIKHNVILEITGLIPTDGILGGLLGAALCCCASMNIITAPSISIEGRTLWIVRSMPVRTADVLASKVMCHLAVCVPFVAVCGLCCGVTLEIPAVEIALAIVLGCVMTLFFAMLGLIMNLALPKFDWISEIHAIKQSSSPIITMLLSMVIAIAAIALYFAVAGIMSVRAYMAALTALFAAISFFMGVCLSRGGCRKFETL